MIGEQEDPRKQEKPLPPGFRRRMVPDYTAPPDTTLPPGFRARQVTPEQEFVGPLPGEPEEGPGFIDRAKEFGREAVGAVGGALERGAEILDPMRLEPLLPEGLERIGQGREEIVGPPSEPQYNPAGTIMVPGAQRGAPPTEGGAPTEFAAASMLPGARRRDAAMDEFFERNPEYAQFALRKFGDLQVPAAQRGGEPTEFPVTGADVLGGASAGLRTAAELATFKAVGPLARGAGKLTAPAAGAVGRGVRAGAEPLARAGRYTPGVERAVETVAGATAGAVRGAASGTGFGIGREAIEQGGDVAAGMVTPQQAFEEAIKNVPLYTAFGTFLGGLFGGLQAGAARPGQRAAGVEDYINLTERPDPFRVLGLERGATREQIHAAWKHLSARMTREVNRGGSEEALKVVNSARDAALMEVVAAETTAAPEPARPQPEAPAEPVRGTEITGTPAPEPPSRLTRQTGAPPSQIEAGEQGFLAPSGEGPAIGPGTLPNVFPRPNQEVFGPPPGRWGGALMGVEPEAAPAAAAEPAEELAAALTPEPPAAPEAPQAAPRPVPPTAPQPTAAAESVPEQRPRMEIPEELAGRERVAKSAFMDQPGIVQGNETTVQFAEEGIADVMAQRVLVPLNMIVPSHQFTAAGMPPNPDYPEPAQGRAYHDNEDARADVLTKSQKADPLKLLDRTNGVGRGPPLINAAGEVIAGHGRVGILSLGLQRDATFRHKYQEELTKHWPEGFADIIRARFKGDPSKVWVEVRLVDDEAGAFQDVQAMQDLNLGSDVPDQKVKSMAEEAAEFSTRLKGAPAAIDHFINTFDPTNTLFDYLGGGEGKTFVGYLQTQRVFPAGPKYIKGGKITDAGKLLIQSGLEDAAYGQPQQLEQAPGDIKRKLDSVTASMVQSAQLGFDIAPRVLKSFEVINAFRSWKADNPRTGKQKGVTFQQWREIEEDSAFPRFAPVEFDFAEIILNENAASLKQKFRDYAENALAGADMAAQPVLGFGYTPTTQGEAFEMAFGIEGARFALDKPPPGPKTPPVEKPGPGGDDLTVSFGGQKIGTVPGPDAPVEKPGPGGDEPTVLLGEFTGKNVKILEERGWGRMWTAQGRNIKSEAGEPWGLDNGAWRMYSRAKKAGEPAHYDFAKFEANVEKALAMAENQNAPMLVVLPDMVAEGEASLSRSLGWLDEYETALAQNDPVAFAFGVKHGNLPFYLAVQNGVAPSHLEGLRSFEDDELYTDKLAGIFLGGDDAYKAQYGEVWAEFAKEHNLKFHYGRAGTPTKVKHAREIGAGSLDSALPLMAPQHLEKFIQALGADLEPAAQLEMDLQGEPTDPLADPNFKYEPRPSFQPHKYEVGSKVQTPKGQVGTVRTVGFYSTFGEPGYEVNFDGKIKTIYERMLSSEPAAGGEPITPARVELNPGKEGMTGPSSVNLWDVVYEGPDGKEWRWHSYTEEVANEVVKDLAAIGFDGINKRNLMASAGNFKAYPSLSYGNYEVRISGTAGATRPASSWANAVAQADDINAGTPSLFDEKPPGARSTSEGGFIGRRPDASHTAQTRAEALKRAREFLGLDAPQERVEWLAKRKLGELKGKSAAPGGLHTYNVRAAALEDALHAGPDLSHRQRHNIASWLLGEDGEAFGERARPGKSERGAVGVEAVEGQPGVFTLTRERVVGAGKALGGEARRQFTTIGDLPQDVFNRKVQKDGWLSKQLRLVEFTLRDFGSAVREVRGVKGVHDLTNEELAQINDVLAGALPADVLPKPIADMTRQMRAEIDAMTRRLIDSGIVEGDLVAKMEENYGVYLNRSYRVFDDPKWAQKVPQDVRNKAKALLRGEIEKAYTSEDGELQLTPEELEEQTEGLIAALLFREEGGPLEFFTRGKLGSKNLSILQKRLDISPEIRALMGEYLDPRVNYVRSMSKMAHLIANHEFLTDVREAGLEQIFYQVPMVRDGVEYSALIAAEASEALAPLNGLYTTPEIRKAFETIEGAHPVGPFIRHYMKVNGTVKLAKTVGSVMTHIRNFMANPMFLVANGNWPFRSGVMGRAAFYGNVNFTELIAKKLGADTPAARAYFARLTELGVVGESTRANELRDVVNDATKRAKYTDDYGIDPTRSMIKKGIDVAGTAYLAEDDYWKIRFFEAEKRKYQWAYPDMPEAEVEQIAARITRNGMPTYSMVPPGLKVLRRSPLVGTFVSFPAEVYRTSYHTLKLAHDEIKSDNPNVRALGWHRIAGMLVAAAIIPAATKASRLIHGIAVGDDDDIRQFTPPWSTNSSIFYTGRKANGDVGYIDLSYTDPHNYLRKPLIALLTGQNWEERLSQATLEIARPFIGEEILAEKLFDIARNTKVNGGQVFNPAADPFSRQMDKLSHIWDALEPGTLSSMQRIDAAASGEKSQSGRSYDLSEEVAALFSGIRFSRVDVRQALAFKARDSAEAIKNAERILLSPVAQRGTVTQTDIRKAHAQMDASRQKSWNEARMYLEAANRLGVGIDELGPILVQAGWAQSDAAAILVGYYPAYRPSDQFYGRTIGPQTEAKRELVNALADSTQAVHTRAYQEAQP